MSDRTPSLEILDAHSKFHCLEYEKWRHHELFTWQWWAHLAVLIIPWLIWWKLVDRNRKAQILCYGFIVMFFIILMDAHGIVFRLWIYPIRLFPLIPHAVSIDWGLLPVVHMLIYQYFPRWKQFLLAETVAAALLAFVGEPFAIWINVYQPLHWQHIWSFPIYILKAVVGKLLMEKIIYR